MYFFFYIFDGWSIVKLTGSMFFLSMVSYFFRLMVGLQVEGRLGVVLGCSKGVCGWSWAAPRASVGGPGSLSGLLWAVLGRLGAFVGGPGPSWVRFRVLCWRSWVTLGAYVRGLGPHVGGLGPLLRAMLAVLAALGASVGGPEPPWAEKSRGI